MLFLFSCVFVVALLGLMVGLVKPSVVRMDTRKGVGKVFGTVAFVGMVGGAATTPKPPS